MLAGTAIDEVGLSNVGFVDFYPNSCLSEHDNIAVVDQPLVCSSKPPFGRVPRLKLTVRL